MPLTPKGQFDSNWRLSEVAAKYGNVIDSIQVSFYNV